LSSVVFFLRTSDSHLSLQPPSRYLLLASRVLLLEISIWEDPEGRSLDRKALWFNVSTGLYPQSCHIQMKKKDFMIEWLFLFLFSFSLHSCRCSSRPHIRAFVYKLLTYFGYLKVTKSWYIMCNSDLHKL